MLVSSNSTIFQYEGCIDQNLVSNINFNIKQNARFNTIDKIAAKKNKLIILAVEILQNIIKHSNNYFDKEGVYEPSSFFIIHNNLKNTVTFNMKNALNKADLQTFTKKIDYTNSLSADELSEAYKQQLKSGSLSDKNGAGLGLYEIRRIIKNKIEYRVDYKNETVSNFAYSITLNL